MSLYEKISKKVKISGSNLDAVVKAMCEEMENKFHYRKKKVNACQCGGNCSGQNHNE